LAAQKIIVESVSSVDEILAKKNTVLILDVGDDIEQAIRILDVIRVKASIVKTIVCVAGLVPPKKTQLVSAGSSDALSSPPSPDLLGKKVGRILRRGR
jgi:serine/threonine-protein kinase